MRIDDFFEKQPSAKFIENLCCPIHMSKYKNFNRTLPRDGEVCVNGIYINTHFPHGDEILATAYDDFNKFLDLQEIHGDSYPINIHQCSNLGEEAFVIFVGESSVEITAEECEGVRRAIFYLEEEMIKREGPILPLGKIKRTPTIKRRITRGFFSPTNRAPKWGDELYDNIDYYSDEYLNRLAHNGTNGLWIYTSFSQLVRSPYMPEKGDGCEQRMKKLASVVEKCKRYGVKVYVFAIEPMGLLPEERALHPELLGSPAPDYPGARQPMCPRLNKVREHVIYCLEHIFKTIPDLGGYIDITAGERPTSCASVVTYEQCPRCKNYSRGENLAYAVDVIKEGLRRAGTGAEFISWTYGHRYWDDNDIAEYVDKAPDDIVFMQNFEDRGIDHQLGKPRLAWDYWLSYPGPSDMFVLTAKRAAKNKKKIYAKMQVCTSHEMATVPYIPVPGILFDKYKEATSLGVTGIMECWYFGNYPSLMNRASTELSYLSDYNNKEEFLYELAARLYGQSKAKNIANAWSAFEEGYRNYPTNIMFSYYGPMHDGVVWDLFPIPKNNALPRSWLLLDPPDGDRIGECLFKGHTLDEALILAERMNSLWQKGLSFLSLEESNELTTCAEAIGILISSGYHILKFYKNRELLGKGASDPWLIVTEMENLVSLEIKNAKRMIMLCETDTRLGYHSEAEGFKFFPEKLKARIAKLERLYDTDFKEIRSRLLCGKVPLGYYYAEDQETYLLDTNAEYAKWCKLDNDRAFCAYIDNETIKLHIKCKESDTFAVCYEFELFHPESVVVFTGKTGDANRSEFLDSNHQGLALGVNVLSHQSVWGDSIETELSKYHVESKYEAERAEHILTTIIPEGSWNKKNAIKLFLRVGNRCWKKSSEPIRTLGKADISPDEFGFMLPI